MLRIYAALPFLLGLISHVLASPSSVVTASPAATPLAAAAPPPLGVGWNPSARNNQWNVFTGLATYANDAPDFDDPTLVGLARQAYNEMIGSADWQGMDRKPAAMAALKVGKEVFFASSVRGHNEASFAYDWLTPQDSDTDANQLSSSDPAPTSIIGNTGISQSELAAAIDARQEIEIQLEACRMQQMQTRQGQIVKGRHKFNANCGEVMALHQYYIAHPFDPINVRSAVVATWGTNKGIQGLKDACGGPKKIPLNWGCWRLMTHVNVRVIREDQNISPTDSTIAPARVEQLAMCERYD